MSLIIPQDLHVSPNANEPTTRSVAARNAGSDLIDSADEDDDDQQPVQRASTATELAPARSPVRSVSLQRGICVIVSGCWLSVN